jgi:hypothetical protein
MKPKILRKGDDFIHCEVAYVKDITTRLLDSLLCGGIKTAYFRFPPLKKFPQDGLPFADVDARYALKLGFTARPGGIRRLGKISGRPKLHLAIPATPDEMADNYIRTDREYFLKHFAKLLPENEKGYSRRVVKKGFANSDVVLLLLDGKTVGMACLNQPRERYGEMCRLLAWDCISPKLTKAQRLDAHYQLSGWLMKLCADVALTAHVDAFNVRSQKFHFKLGMRPDALAARVR